MQTKKQKLARYPKDWKLRSKFVRYIRARNKCEWCGVENHSIRNGSRIVLTTAHVFDKRPEVANLMNLAALCQKCHLSHDRDDAISSRRQKVAAGLSKRYAPIKNIVNHEMIELFNQAEKEHQKAKQAYTRYIRSRIKRAGSAEAAARKAKMPPTTIREALKRGSYLAIRNCAHAILKAVGK